MKALRLIVGGAFLLLLPAVCQAGIGTELNGLGSFGVSLGAMRWLADEDASEYEGNVAQIRPIGKVVFRYRFSTRWLFSCESGYGWNSYDNSDNLVTSVIPATFGLERRVGELSGATVSACAGTGLYIWAQRRGGNFLLDPETSHKLHGLDPGIYLGGSGEFHVSDHVTSTTYAKVHYILNIHSDDFPAVLGGDDVFIEFGIGLNYYFSPYGGMIWKPGDED